MYRAWAIIERELRRFRRSPVLIAMYSFTLVIAIAAIADVKVIFAGGISGAPRIARHLWRMCFAFFIATGSFFLGQQKVMPVAVRGSPVLFVLAFAPFLVMAFWLVRLHFAKFVGRLRLRLPSTPAAAAST